jgi:hypothetical protein
VRAQGSVNALQQNIRFRTTTTRESNHGRTLVTLRIIISCTQRIRCALFIFGDQPLVFVLLDRIGHEVV